MQTSNLNASESEFAKLLLKEVVDKLFNIGVVLGHDPVINVILVLLGHGEDLHELVGVSKGDLVNLLHDNNWLRFSLFVTFWSKDFLLRVSSLGVLGLLDRLGLSGFRTELGEHVLADELVGKSVEVVHPLITNPFEELLSHVLRNLEDSHHVHRVLFVLGKLVGLLDLLLDLLLLSFQSLLLSFLLGFHGFFLSFLLGFHGFLLSFLDLLHGLLLSFLELLLLFLHLLLLGFFTILEESVEGLFGLFLEDSWVISTRNEWLLAFFVNNGKESVRSLVWVVELQKWMLVWDSGFALGTEIVVLGD